jgi:hypothetical protein
MMEMVAAPGRAGWKSPARAAASLNGLTWDSEVRALPGMGAGDGSGGAATWPPSTSSRSSSTTFSEAVAMSRPICTRILYTPAASRSCRAPVSVKMRSNL